jgi:hypothetical protein
VTVKAPPRSVYHSSKRVNYGGGVYSDTAAGTKAAARQDKGWIDKNGHFMHRTRAGVRLGPQDDDLVWVNAHGAPYNPPCVPDGKKFEDLAWENHDCRGLQMAIGVFKDCKKHNVRVEWEVKDIHPYHSAAHLKRMFNQLRESAIKAFGKNWANWVTIKMLTNLRGGIKFMKRVLRAAHAAGFKTMALARGYWETHPINEPYITWNRGGVVK